MKILSKFFKRKEVQSKAILENVDAGMQNSVNTKSEKAPPPVRTVMQDEKPSSSASYEAKPIASIPIHMQGEIYDMSTVEGIEAIPVPAQHQHTGDSRIDSVYYALQRRATAHKKAGRMDCAIACLKKSNELSDYEERPLLLEKDYFRLVKYIQATGDLEWAEREKQKIYERHPEFLDKRISNLKRIEECLNRCSDFNEDLVILQTNRTCSICKEYNWKVYSISGKTHKYPKLPTKISKEGGFCPNCIITLSVYFEGITKLQ